MRRPCGRQGRFLGESMKKFHFLILISVVLCVILAFTLIGCNKNALPRPTGLSLDGPTLTLTWKDIKDASYYVVNISGNGVNTDKNTRKPSLSLANTGLEEGEYSVKVKACGDGKEHTDSPWSDVLTYAQDKDSGLTFKFINRNTEVEVTGLGRADGNVVVPDTFRGVPVTGIGDRAFSNKSKLTGIVIGNNVTKIGSNAFYNCTFLESITLPQGLKVIGDRAFQSCRLLAGKLTLPKNITAIGENAFAYCTSLTEIAFGSNVETIGVNAFAYCSSLESITIPDSVTSIGNSAFFSCTSAKTLSLGKGVQSIGEYAFASCDGFKQISLNDGLKAIGNYAFGRCNGLEKVVFSNTVETVGEGAFYLDEKLANVTLGSGIKRIAVDAFLDTAIWKNAANEVYLCNWFLGCKDKTISYIQIADGTIGIANAALSGFENLPSVQLPNSVKIIGDTAFATSKVTTVVIGSGVEEIGTKAFYKCESLSTVILGDYDTGKMTNSSLKVINSYAFMNCTLLASIEIPDTVELISSYAFNNSALYKQAANGIVYAGNWVVGCDNTRANGTVVIEDGTVGIANFAFYKCSNITEVQIPESVATIGRSAFYQCSKLRNVNLPSQLKEIADYTFYECTVLTLPTLPQTLKSIGRSAFYKCALANATGEDTDNDVLVIPDSVETIGDFAFFGCGYVRYDLENMLVIKCGIDAVIFGSGVKHIGNNAFNGVTSLKRVELGSNVQTVGDKAFYKCEAITQVVLNEGLKSIGARAFYGCNKLTSVVLPNSLTAIDDYAFYRCAGLTEIHFGANVQTIGDFAFFGCVGLTSFSVPSSVTSIGRQAFRACTGLKSVVLTSNVTDIDMHAFYGCGALTIYAQDAQAKEGWNERFNSSYRPIVWGCEIRDGYVYALTMGANTISYLNTVNTLSAPERAGYRFVGWATSEGATEIEYSAENLDKVADGTKVFAVWAVDND